MTPKLSFKEIITITLIFLVSFVMAYAFPPLAIHMVLVAIVVSLLVSKQKH